MAELYFQHYSDPYLFDTKLLKLYRLKGKQTVEIDNPQTSQKVRYDAVEISREQALKMAAECALEIPSPVVGH